MPVCGPTCSLCGIILSVWGVIQLGLMGVFFYIHSFAFADDIGVELKMPEVKNATTAKKAIDQFNDDVDRVYSQSAYNCWIAAAIYLVLLLFSVQQFRANMRK
jgi:ribonuclease kappa